MLVRRAKSRRPTTTEGDEMAELTNLESKLGEVTGLAMAAQVATERVIRLAKGEASDLVAALEKINQEAAETERRCTELAGTFEGKKTAILDEARTTKGKGAEMLKIYLDQDSDALDGFEFLTMAEAGEVGHWGVLQQMSQRAGHEAVGELTRWALPIQQRHLEGALAGSEKLAASEDPDETA
jgi:hypothetical protein